MSDHQIELELLVTDLSSLMLVHPAFFEERQCIYSLYILSVRQWSPMGVSDFKSNGVTLPLVKRTFSLIWCTVIDC